MNPHNLHTSSPSASACPDSAPAQPDRRVHVLEVVGNAIVGGMESCVERLIERLPRDRFVVTVLCPFESPFTDRLRALDTEVLITPMPEDPPWTSIQLAATLVSSRGVDLLHGHLPNGHLLAGLAGRLAGRPVMTTVHGRQLSMLDLELHRLVGSHLSVVCQQSYFHALGAGVDPAHLSCEPNGVDIQVFQPRPGGAAGLRDSLGLGADTPLVGFVGRLSPEKGPEVFVRAALLLKSRRPEAHTVLVGEGPMLSMLHGLVAQYGLGGQSHFAGPRTDMPAVYNELDVVVSTSHSEAMPLALMEAMASGLPVIATRVGGVPDMLEHGQTGWLVAPNDFEDVAARCATLVADPGLRSRMGQRARARVIERMGLDGAVERVAQLMERLVGVRELDILRRPPALLNAVNGTPITSARARRSVNGASAVP